MIESDTNMLTVIINGSPHKDGDTAALISALKEKVGGDFLQFDAYDDDILPCQDCRACWVNDSCAIKDGFEDLLDAVNKADNIVLASPIYFSEITGPLLSVISRWQYVWVSKHMRNTNVLQDKDRRGIILLTGGGQGKPEKALDTATCILRQMGAKTIDCVSSLNTDHLAASRDEAAMQQIRNLFK